MTALLSVNDISKSFVSTKVLSSVSLTISAGEIVSIIGENGAGKSTLAKIIAGIVQADSGSINFDGQQVSFLHPLDAIKAGIGMVHQELNLIENLSVLQNLMLGREETRYGFLTHGKIAQAAAQTLADLAPSISPHTKVSALSSAQKQLVEIARSLSYNAKLLIFDEPTSSLSEREAEHLLQIIEKLKEQNVSIIYVSHRLAEVERISDTIYALRDGQVSGKSVRGEFSRKDMIQMMIGRDLKELYPYRERSYGDTVLKLAQYKASPRHHVTNLMIRAGEIVGIAGLVGSGRTEFLEALFGLNEYSEGSLEVNNTFAEINNPAAAIDASVALVPESRKEQGLFLESSIQDNITIANLFSRSKSLIRNFSSEQHNTTQLIKQLKVKCRDSQQKVKELSGGNQQKVVIAKWLLTKPKILLLDEPTRGVDIGARSEIYSILFDLAQSGVAIIFVSSELEEVIGISDRVFVMNDGKIQGELPRDKLTEHAIISLASSTQEVSI